MTRRQLAILGALLLLSVVVAVGLFEILFPGRLMRKLTGARRVERLAGEPTSPGFIEALHEALSGSRWPLGAYRHHPTIGWIMAPGFAGPMLDGSFYVAVHRLGFRVARDAEREAVEPGGILALGCSFSFGDQVEAEEAWCAVAGRALGRPCYNFAACGHSYASAVLRLADLEQEGVLDVLRPSVVVLGAGHWLERRSQSPYYPTTGLQFGYAYLSAAAGEVRIAQPPPEHALARLFELRQRYFPAGRRDGELTPTRRRLLAEIAPAAASAIRSRRAWRRGPGRDGIPRRELYDFVLSSLRRITAPRGIPLVILWQIGKNGYPVPAELWAVAGQWPDVAVVDGGAELRDVPLVFRRRRHHPTVRAHRIMGEQLAAALRSP